MSASSLKLIFAGGAGSVTGANFLLEYQNENGLTSRLLIDCGLVQGSRVAEESNRLPFIYDPSTIDALFVTHAHLDHIGRIPKLIHDGFRGPIYSTAPTKDMAELSLTDSLGVLTKEAKQSHLPLLYSLAEVSEAMAAWRGVPYQEIVAVGPYRITLWNANHILGSAMIQVEIRGTTVLFTGDLGGATDFLA